MGRLNQKGVLLIEIILAVAVFGMITLIILSAFTYGREGTAIAGDNNRAAQVANEAVEALHNISQSAYTNLGSYTNGTTYYLDTTGTQWAISNTPKIINNLYTPAIVFSNGPNGSRQVTVNVTWRINTTRTGQASATTYLTNWQTASAAATIKTGLLVYANGGTTTNLIDYRLLQSSGFWTSPVALPTAGAANNVPRSVKMYPAQTGTNKVVLARYYDGSKQYIYAFVWSGASWGAPKLLTSWTSSAALDSGNFSGTYLANGNFIAVYNDNTNAPKYTVMTSGVWGAQASVGSISADSTDSPTSMIIHARPGSNEAMIALLGNDFETITKYYANGAWAANYTIHASNGTTNGTHNVDFDWSSADSVHGALIFTTGSSDRTPSVRVFTANGSGGGTWGAVMTSTNQPLGSIVQSVAIAGQAGGTATFTACDKDSASPQHIYCYTATPTTLTNPTNPILAAATAAGGQQTMELTFEQQVGSTGLAAYSDNTTSTKVKRFLSGTNTWDASPVAAPVAASIIQKTKIIAEPGLNDAIVLMIDSQNNLYTNMYNGNANSLYTTPTGYAWTIHNANGPSVGAKWFDFAWDN
jgi:hypothetical protein